MVDTLQVSRIASKVENGVSFPWEGAWETCFAKHKGNKKSYSHKGTELQQDKESVLKIWRPTTTRRCCSFLYCNEYSSVVGPVIQVSFWEGADQGSFQPSVCVISYPTLSLSLSVYLAISKFLVSHTFPNTHTHTMNSNTYNVMLPLSKLVKD